GEVKRIPDYPLEMFRKVLDVNVVGVFLGMKHVLPTMLKSKKGSIINTASIAGIMGSPLIAVYSASKHAVIGLTKSAAWECTGTGVRVTCACPGMIDSRMLSTILQGRAGGNEPPPLDKIVDRIPARRLGQASEVAAIVAFLASDDASYVSGSHYTVDCGRTAARRCRPQHHRTKMPVVLDPDSKAVYKAFLEANRPPYENGTPAQAREMYLAARFVSNPEPPELESAKDISIPAPHGAIPARIYTPRKLRR